jgi:S1-C subfamily serine protease
VELDGQTVEDVQSLVRITRETVQDREKPVPVLAAFERDTKRFLTVVNLGIEDLRRPGREVRKAWLPVETQVISRDIARHLDRPDLRGFAVTHVYAETPAAKAGLRPADFITEVDGRPMSASAPEHYEELETMIRQYPVGATVELSVLRNNRQMTVPVKLIRAPRPKREMEKYRSVEFGFTGRNLAFFDKAENQWGQDQGGVLIKEVQSGSWAELASLYVNDLIVAVDGEPVEDTQALKQRMEKVVSEQPRFLVMKVLRGVHSRFLELEPDWD